ncbi:hypothetical protein ACS5PU_02140 [Pedobacter sp. GSP4]|uniref:hypothetical protein n=1 Tax=Pedobacter sp. GSP4 TaxID=3453716 RepID=UPI003EE8A59F
MFGLFKRKKIQSWEVQLLENTLSALPQDFKMYIGHIALGLLKGVSIGNAAIPGYVGFTRDADIYNAVHDPKGRDFEVYGIRVFDLMSRTYLEFSIFFSFGTVDGYSINKPGKFELDVKQIDVKNRKMRFRDNIDFDRVKKVLLPEELELVNPNDIYAVHLDNKEYFHVMEIADGDFYGVDLDKNLYKITHDPYKIEKLDLELQDILRDGA